MSDYEGINVILVKKRFNVLHQTVFVSVWIFQRPTIVQKSVEIEMSIL